MMVNISYNAVYQRSRGDFVCIITDVIEMVGTTMVAVDSLTMAGIIAVGTTVDLITVALIIVDGITVVGAAVVETTYGL